MKRKIFGWILFSLGVLIFLTNLGFTVGWNVLYGESIQWFGLIWPWVLVWVGWRLAHPKKGS